MLFHTKCSSSLSELYEWVQKLKLSTEIRLDYNQKFERRLIKTF